MDEVKVQIAERMHYQGIIEIDLDKQLEEIKQRKLEQQVQENLEDDLMEEFLNENGLLEERKVPQESSKETRDENWDAFQSLEEFQSLNNQFTKINKQLQKNVKLLRKQKLYNHYKALKQKYLQDKYPEKLLQEYEQTSPEEYESNYCRYPITHLNFHLNFFLLSLTLV